MAADFKIEIRSQRWLNDDPAGRYEDGSMDACSHGSINCEIGGVQVTSDDDDYGISQSALHLLHTLEQDRHAVRGGDELPMDRGYLLCHGCGYPLGFGCTNFGTDWHVRHDAHAVVLSNARFSSHTIVPAVTVRVPIEIYRREIVEFAREARRFYWAFGQRSVEDWELAFHQRFWAEFEERLGRAEDAMGTANVSHADKAAASEP